MYAAFLKERKMKLKTGNVLSDEQCVTGGAVQGSVLGVMDHNVVMEFVDENMFDQEIYKYVDDLTLNEEIAKDINFLVDG